MTGLLRLRFWVEREATDDDVLRFRRAFAAIWLLHDLADLVLGGTTLQHAPFDSGRPPLLTALQLGLCAAQLGMLLSRSRAVLFTGLALLLRLVQAAYYPLNDFFYFSVVAALLAVPGNPRWRREALVWQTAWLYLATALLKLNGEWLSGGHLFVRLGYLWQARGWPHPRSLEGCMVSLPCTSLLAWGAVLAEITLAVLLLTGRGRRPALLLAVGIHLFAALALNVWFFGASMIAQVTMLFPRRPPT